MALGVVASFTGGALLVLGLGGSKAVAALIFTLGLIGAGLAVRHMSRAVGHVDEPLVVPARPEPEWRSVRRVPDTVRREPAPIVEEPAHPVEDDDIELTAAAPAVDAVVQALSDLRDEASATEALLARLAARRAGAGASAPGAIRGMTSANAPAPPLS